MISGVLRPRECGIVGRLGVVLEGLLGFFPKSLTAVIVSGIMSDFETTLDVI